MRGFRHYVDRRGKGELRSSALSDIDSGLGDLTRHWHTFDLESIAARTDELLTLAKAKYEATREARRTPKPDN